MTETSPRNLRAEVASGDALDVRQFTVEERLSSLFSVTLLVTCDNPDIDFEAVVGQPASFTMQASRAALAPERTWRGVASRFRLVAAEDTGLSSYHLTIVPSLWLATQRRNHRMFQHLSEPDIALRLLEEWGVKVEKRLTDEHKKRKYRVQYGESDFAFLARMLEESGVTFFFEDRGDETVLVLTDAPQRGEPRARPLRFLDNPTEADRDHATGLRLDRQVLPGRFTIRDHDYRQPPTYKLLATAAIPGVEERLERFDYVPGAFLFGTDKGDATPSADDRGKTRTDEAQGAILAQKRLEASRGSATVCSFATNALDVAPGMILSFAGHPRKDLGTDKEWLVTAVTHGGTHDSEWTFHADARSAAFPYRPDIVTPRPRVNGVESATVVGPEGEEIHCDEFGRVRVHFHWDRESRMDEQSSCWIHVSQAWGGAGYGGMNLPRVGQEVLVDFLGGDPDRPVIVGRLYTNLQKVPYGLPANKTQSGLKSNSTGGTGGYNELMFEDAAGKELVRMQAEKDMHKLVKNDEHHTVGRDRTRGVKRNENVSVGKNRTKRVKRNERVVIGQNQSVTVGTNRTAQIGGNDSVTVGGQHVLTVTDMFGGTGTTITTASHLIKLDSGMGATLMLNGANIRLQADSIDLVGTSGITVSVSGGEVKINGGPNVVINGPGLRAARVTDPVGGKILEGSPTVFIGPAPPAPTTDEETIDQAIENIKASPFGQTPEGRRVIAKIEQLRREGKIRFADLGPNIRGQSGSDGITANTTYNRDPQGTASELVHEATHQLDDDDYPGKTGNSIDEEERTNTNQLDLYESQRRGGYRDPDLELRRADRLNGRLRDNIRGRYPTSPEQRPR